MIKKENQLLANALQVHMRWICKSETGRMLCEKLSFSNVLCNTEENIWLIVAMLNFTHVWRYLQARYNIFSNSIQ